MEFTLVWSLEPLMALQVLRGELKSRRNPEHKWLCPWNKQIRIMSIPYVNVIVKTGKYNIMLFLVEMWNGSHRAYRSQGRDGLLWVVHCKVPEVYFLIWTKFCRRQCCGIFWNWNLEENIRALLNWLRCLPGRCIRSPNGLLLFRVQFTFWYHNVPDSQIFLIYIWL